MGIKVFTIVCLKKSVIGTGWDQISHLTMTPREEGPQMHRTRLFYQFWLFWDVIIFYYFGTYQLIISTKKYLQSVISSNLWNFFSDIPCIWSPSVSGITVTCNLVTSPIGIWDRSELNIVQNSQNLAWVFLCVGSLFDQPFVFPGGRRWQATTHRAILTFIRLIGWLTDSISIQIEINRFGDWAEKSLRLSDFKVALWICDVIPTLCMCVFS